MRRLTTVIFCGGLIFLHLCLPLRANSKATTFRLTNGLRVILAPVEKVKAVCVLLYHLNGVRHDPPEIKGGSYLYQNLMRLGATKNLDPLDRIIFLNRSGGISAHTVNYDYSIFYQVVPDSEINNALWLESERISSLKLTNRNITFEKNKVYSRNYRSINFYVNVKAVNWVRANIFEGLPYEIPIYGNLEEIKKFDLQSIKGLYKNFGNLSRIIMVIAGGFNPGELKESIMKHFGGLSSPIPPGTFKKNYIATAPRTEYVYDNWILPKLSEPFVMYGVRAPSKFSNDHLYFEFIRYYLLDERISKLDEQLNRGNKLDITLNHQFTDHFEANALIFWVSAKRRANLERAKYYLNKQLAALQKGRPGTLSHSEVKLTKTVMELDFMKKMSRLQERSIFLAENYHSQQVCPFNGHG